jgi:hypothetical protein
LRSVGEERTASNGQNQDYSNEGEEESTREMYREAFSQQKQIK